MLCGSPNGNSFEGQTETLRDARGLTLSLMSCGERERLETEHTCAGVAFDAARQALQARIGVSPRAEFFALNQATERAWEVLQHARKTLDRHIREHGCELAGPAGSER